MPEIVGRHPIESEEDIVKVRTTIRRDVSDLGFGLTDTTRIVTAVSELARNIYRYAGTGEARWRTVETSNGPLFEVVFEDDGPGIEDVEMALEPGVSSSDGLGRGLSGSKQLVDEFDLETEPGAGTTVTIGKYVP